REEGVDRHAAGIDVGGLIVEAETRLERQVAEEHRVADVEVGGLHVVGEVAVLVRLERAGAEAVAGIDVSLGAHVEEVQAVARPRAERADVGVTVAKAELQLVREAAGVEESRAVDAVLVLRTLGVVVVIAVVRETVAGGAEVPGRRLAAETALDRVAARAVVGDELEAALDLRIEAGQVEARAE